MAKQSVLMKTNFFNKREIAELPRLLVAGERVLAMISGVYTAGTALLCVTTKRVLLVDKKLMRLSIEDMRFDAIKEVNYSHQAVMASLQLFYVGRSQQFQFKSWHRGGLRELSQLVQEKMFEVSDAREGKDVPTEAVSESIDNSTPQAEETIPFYTTNKYTEKHLRDRLARWRHAGRFPEVLRFSSKAGKQVLRFEVHGLTKH